MRIGQSIDRTVGWQNAPIHRYLRLRLTSVIAAIPSLQQLDDQGRDELVAAIGQEIAQPLREYTVGDEIVMLSGVQIAHAWR